MHVAGWIAAVIDGIRVPPALQITIAGAARFRPVTRSTTVRLTAKPTGIAQTTSVGLQAVSAAIRAAREPVRVSRIVRIWHSNFAHARLKRRSATPELVLTVTDGVGFEPTLRFCRKHTFQACALNHSATHPRAAKVSRTSDERTATTRSSIHLHVARPCPVTAGTGPADITRLTPRARTPIYLCRDRSMEPACPHFASPTPLPSSSSP